MHSKYKAVWLFFGLLIGLLIISNNSITQTSESNSTNSLAGVELERVAPMRTEEPVEQLLPEFDFDNPPVLRQPILVPELNSAVLSSGFSLPFDETGNNVGAVYPDSDITFSFELEGNEHDIVDFSFRRLRGNLNLSIAIMSSENDIVFRANLVTSELLSTRFTLPTTGEYVIAVYRIDLIPPDEPEDTIFVLNGTINPQD